MAAVEDCSLFFILNYNLSVRNYVEELGIEQLYLAVVFLVFPGKGNIHGIWHDVDCSLIIVPVFSVGFLEEKL